MRFVQSLFGATKEIAENRNPVQTSNPIGQIIIRIFRYATISGPASPLQTEHQPWRILVEITGTVVFVPGCAAEVPDCVESARVNLQVKQGSDVVGWSTRMDTDS